MDLASATLRAFAILEIIAKSSRPMSLAEVTAASGLPKPTTHRILVLLQRAGMLQREPNGKLFSVGARLSRLSLDVSLNVTLSAPRHAILQNLVDAIGETCNLTMRDGNEVVYLDRVETPWPLRLDLQCGSRVPLHCTASGKLFLSQLPRRYRQRMIDGRGLKRFTDKTITDPQLLEAELDRVRSTRVATDNEEFLVGSVCVAVPIADSSGRVCASVAVQAPAARMSLDQALERVPALQQAAAALALTFSIDPPTAEEAGAHYAPT